MVLDLGRAPTFKGGVCGWVSLGLVLSTTVVMCHEMHCCCYMKTVVPPQVFRVPGLGLDHHVGELQHPLTVLQVWSGSLGMRDIIIIYKVIIISIFPGIIIITFIVVTRRFGQLCEPTYYSQ